MPAPGKVVETIHNQLGELVVRYPRADDAEALLAFINPISAEQTFILFQGEQLTIGQEQAWLDDRLAAIANGTAVMLILERGRSIFGTCAVYRKALAERHVGEFGITLARDARGIGLGRRLMRLTLSEAERVLDGLRIVELTVFSNNPRAMALYRSEGFVEHGVLPGGVLHQGAYVDHIHMHRHVGG